MDAAWELGVRYFDTAPHYGLGLSERRLGAALAARPRDEYVVSTKVGRLLEPADVVDGLDDEGFAVPATHRRVWDFSRDGIRRSLAESLERLGLDRVDIVYLHDPDDHWDDGARDRLSRPRRAARGGSRRRDRRGHEPGAMLADSSRHTDVDVLMLAGRYTLLEQDSARRAASAVRGAGVGDRRRRRLQQRAAGTCTSVPTTRSTTTATRRRRSSQRARAIADICERHGTTLPAAAIAFPLAHPAVVSVCVGARSAEQVERNATLYRERIPPELWSELKAEGLIREDAPVPA